LAGGLAAPVSGEALPDVEEVRGRACPLATLLLPLATAPPLPLALARPAAPLLGPAGPDLACPPPAVDQPGRGAPGAAGLFSWSLVAVPLAVAAWCVSLALALALALAPSRLVPLSRGEPVAPALVLGAAGRGLVVLAPRGAQAASPGLPSAVARPSDFMAAVGGTGRRAGVRGELGVRGVRWVTPGASEEEEEERGHRCALGCRTGNQ